LSGQAADELVSGTVLEDEDLNRPRRRVPGALTLENITLSGGVAQSGGAVANSGTLVLNHCVISHNSTDDVQRHLYPAGGGIVNTSGTVIIRNSTIENNDNLHGLGGGIATDSGTVDITGSLVRSNGVGGAP
jgi:hypothetical protein